MYLVYLGKINLNSYSDSDMGSFIVKSHFVEGLILVRGHSSVT